MDWIENARKIPDPESYFRGRALPGEFRLPESILLYFHDCSHERTIVSTRYMLILPVVPMEYRVAGNPVPLLPGEALLVKPYLQRSVPETGANLDRLIVSFEAEGDEEYLPATPVTEVTERAQTHIARMVSAYRRDDTLGALFELVLLLRELGRSPQQREIPRISAAVNLVLNRINQELIRPVSIKILAETAGLSASHLRRRFREEVGISLGEYLAERRLSGAKMLLEETELPVGEIARRCGYDSIYAFSRFFRKEAGLSPRAYRREEIN